MVLKVRELLLKANCAADDFDFLLRTLSKDPESSCRRIALRLFARLEIDALAYRYRSVRFEEAEDQAKENSAPAYVLLRTEKVFDSPGRVAIFFEGRQSPRWTARRT